METIKENISPVNLGCEGVEEAEKYLKKLEDGVDTVAAMYRKGEIIKANKVYSDCIVGLNWFISLVVSLEKLFNINYASIFSSEWEDYDYKEVFPSLFREIIYCQRKGDWTGMADLLEYEINPVLRGWSRFLPEIKSELK